MRLFLRLAWRNLWRHRRRTLLVVLSIGVTMAMMMMYDGLIAGIGILNLLLMAVFERTREIGVLGALGMKPGQISLLFMLEGAMMGLLGVVMGVVLGVVFNAILAQVGIDYSALSGASSFMALISGKIYPTLGLENVVSRSLTSIIIAVLAALYPAREASLCEPAKALHYV